MEIAARIQTSILPRDVNVAGLEIAAAMHAATEVGGDYYDVVPVDDGCWLGIGDVAGHGLGTGLVMLMMQSGIGALARKMPDASPRDLLLALNTMLVENVRVRLGPARTRDADAAALSPRRQPDVRRRARGDPGPPGRHRPLRAHRDARPLGRREARHRRRYRRQQRPPGSPAICWCSTPTALTEAAAGDGQRRPLRHRSPDRAHRGARRRHPTAVRDAVLAAVAAFARAPRRRRHAARRPLLPGYLSLSSRSRGGATSAIAEQLDVEHQRRATAEWSAAGHPRRRRCPPGRSGRACFADLHAPDALGPALDHAVERERRRLRRACASCRTPCRRAACPS